MQASQPAHDITIPGADEHGAATVAQAEPRQDVYVWELPVRITHWVNVITIGILVVTGFYIASPFITTSGPATDQYLMGTVRFIHFVAAFVFTISVLFRVYWAFVGNTYANWRQIVPTKRARRRGIRRMLGFYLFLRREAPAVVGHNPLAGSAYLVVFILFILQIITGFALYALPLEHGAFWATAFGWVIVVFGEQPVRLVHDIIMWLILAFVIHHVYTAILIDIQERSGLVSSIITGFKSLTRHQLEAAQAEETMNDRPRPFWARSSQKAEQDHA
jgi:Ni/Fe-hydrogenase 1 B-type cytochrome subunit